MADGGNNVNLWTNPAFLGFLGLVFTGLCGVLSGLLSGDYAVRHSRKKKIHRRSGNSRRIVHDRRHVEIPHDPNGRGDEHNTDD